VPSPERCADFGPTKGYRLLRDGKLLHEDKSVPQSRGCPLGYRLGAIQTVFPVSGAASFAVLIAVRSFGFEGPDFRWIALTGRL
jgi:predicted secreted protein